MKSRRDTQSFSFLTRDYRDRIAAMEKYRQAARSTAVVLGICCALLTLYIVSFFFKG